MICDQHEICNSLTSPNLFETFHDVQQNVWKCTLTSSTEKCFPTSLLNFQWNRSHYFFNISTEESVYIIIYFHNFNFIARMMKISVNEYVTLIKLSTVFMCTYKKETKSENWRSSSILEGANHSVVQRQVLVILQRGLHFKDMNNEDQRVYKIVKNAFNYSAYTNIVVLYQFIYFKKYRMF
jgi:hypothetical protein